MSYWNYRLTRNRVQYPDGTSLYLYAMREVHYNDEGEVTAWSDQPTTFAGDSPKEVMESLLRAAGSWPTREVFDLDTRQNVRLTLDGKEKP